MFMLVPRLFKSAHLLPAVLRTARKLSVPMPRAARHMPARRAVPAARRAACPCAVGRSCFGDTCSRDPRCPPRRRCEQHVIAVGKMTAAQLAELYIEFSRFGPMAPGVAPLMGIMNAMDPNERAEVDQACNGFRRQLKRWESKHTEDDYIQEAVLLCGCCMRALARAMGSNFDGWSSITPEYVCENALKEAQLRSMNDTLRQWGWQQ